MKAQVKYISAQALIGISVGALVALVLWPDLRIVGVHWPITLGYGSLLITPLWLSRKNMQIFACVLSCAAAWLICRILSIADPNYIAHVPFIYFAVFGVCLFRLQFDLAYLAVAIVLFSWYMCDALAIQGRIPDGRMGEAYWYAVIWNILYSIMLFKSGIKSLSSEGHEKTDSSETHYEQYKKAA